MSGSISLMSYRDWSIQYPTFRRGCLPSWCSFTAMPVPLPQLSSKVSGDCTPPLPSHQASYVNVPWTGSKPRIETRAHLKLKARACVSGKLETLLVILAAKFRCQLAPKIYTLMPPANSSHANICKNKKQLCGKGEFCLVITDRHLRQNLSIMT